MGLLEKAESYRNQQVGKVHVDWQNINGEEKGGNGRGLLEKAIILLSMEAESIGEMVDEEAEEVTSKGLLEKAESFIAEEAGREIQAGLLEKAELYIETIEAQEGIKEYEKKPGLLEKAESLVKEETIEEIKSGTPAQPESYPGVTEEKEGIGEPESLGTKEVYEELEEVLEKGPGLLEKAEATPGKLEVSEKIAEQGYEEKVKIFSEEKIEELATEEKSEIVSIEEFTYEKVSHYQSVLSDKGYSALFDEILEDIKLESGASFCGLYLLEDRAFELEAFIVDESIDVSPFKKSFRIKKNLRSWFVKNSLRLVRVSDLMKKRDKNEVKQFGGYGEWYILPLISEDTLWGFILLDDLEDESALLESDRTEEHVPELKLVKLLTIATVFVARFCSVQKIVAKAERLNKRVNELSTRFDDILVREKAKTLDGLVELIADELGITVYALFLVTEDKKAIMIKNKGLNDKTIKNYRISLRDPNIKKILKSGEPGIIREEQKRVKKIFKYQEPENKRFIVVPVTFGGENIGVFIVNEMDVPGKKLPTTIKKRMSILAGGLVPFLIEERLSRREPYFVIEDWIKRHISGVRRSRKKLCLCVFGIDGIKKAEAKVGSLKISRTLDEIGREIKSMFTSPDSAIRFSCTRWAGVFIAADKTEIKELTKSILESIKSILKKKKLDDLKPKHRLIWYPDDFKDEKKLMVLLG